MLRFVLAVIAVAGFVQPCAAQTNGLPGVTEIAPGVQQIDGGKVPSIHIDAPALEASLKEKKSFSEAKKLLGGGGIKSAGPAKSTVHMYKVHDVTSSKDLVVILFVKGNAILDYLIS